MEAELKPRSSDSKFRSLVFSIETSISLNFLVWVKAFWLLGHLPSKGAFAFCCHTLLGWGEPSEGCRVVPLPRLEPPLTGLPRLSSVTRARRLMCSSGSLCTGRQAGLVVGHSRHTRAILTPSLLLLFPGQERRH